MTQTQKKLRVEEVKRLATPEELELYSYVADRAYGIAQEIAQHIRSSSEEEEGGIFFVYGPVNAGKSLVVVDVMDELEKNGLKVASAQPNVDRPDVPLNLIYSRAGVERPSFSFKTKAEIERLFHENDVVVVDEVNFIHHELQIYFLAEVMRFVERGGWLVAVGMLYTSQRGEFLLSAVLKERAVKSWQVTATCQKCGNLGAHLNQRLVGGRPTESEDPDLLAPSDKVVYEPRCSECHIIIG